MKPSHVASRTVALFLSLALGLPAPTGISPAISGGWLRPKAGACLRSDSLRIEQENTGLEELRRTIGAPVSLFEITEGDKTETARKLYLRYSECKFGAAEQIEYFADLLAQEIRKRYGEAIRRNPDDWLVVTTTDSPPLISTAALLGRSVAEKIGVRPVDLQVHWPEGRTRYTALSTVQDRRALWGEIIHSIHLNVDVAAVRGRKILFIDDMITTGTTIETLSQFLSSRCGVESIKLFTIFSLKDGSPAFESYLGSYLIRKGEFDLLAGILNQADAVITRHAVKTLFDEQDPVFNAVLSSLSTAALNKLREAAVAYYGDPIKQSDKFNRLETQLGGLEQMPLLAGEMISALKKHAGVAYIDPKDTRSFPPDATAESIVQFIERELLPRSLLIKVRVPAEDNQLSLDVLLRLRSAHRDMPLAVALEDPNTLSDIVVPVMARNLIVTAPVSIIEKMITLTHSEAIADRALVIAKVKNWEEVNQAMNAKVVGVEVEPADAGLIRNISEQAAGFFSVVGTAGGVNGQNIKDFLSLERVNYVGASIGSKTLSERIPIFEAILNRPKPASGGLEETEVKWRGYVDALFATERGSRMMGQVRFGLPIAPAQASSGVDLGRARWEFVLALVHAGYKTREEAFNEFMRHLDGAFLRVSDQERRWIREAVDGALPSGGLEEKRYSEKVFLQLMHKAAKDRFDPHVSFLSGQYLRKLKGMNHLEGWIADLKQAGRQMDQQDFGLVRLAEEIDPGWASDERWQKLDRLFRYRLREGVQERYESFED